MRKLLVTVDKKNDVVTEHHGKIFKEVYKEVQGTDVDIYLQKHKEHWAGTEFDSEELIGNAQNDLTMDDYYHAYDLLY